MKASSCPRGDEDVIVSARCAGQPLAPKMMLVREMKPWAGFVPLVASRDLVRSPLRVELEDLALALFRDGEGKACALVDRCPHRFAPLSAGRVRHDGRLACPYHGWHFDGSGRGVSPSQPERVDCDTVAFRTSEAGGFVFVAPPGKDELEPPRAPPDGRAEAEWVKRPAPSVLHRIGFGRQEAGELRLARYVANGAPRFRPFRVQKREVETEHIVSWTLVPESGGSLAPFRPGQHVMVRLSPRANARAVIRSYSLSDAPDGESYRISVKRIAEPSPGLVSNHLHGALVERASIDLAGPFGGFCLPEDDRPLLLVAGGVGITPLFSMLKAAARRERTSSVELFYCARRTSEIFRRAELDELAKSRGVSIRYFITSPDEDLVEGQTRGRLDDDALKSALRSDPDVFVCGPEAMMNDVERALERLGVPPTRVHSERFRNALGPEVASLPACDVTFARTKRTLRWLPGDGTLLELAHKHGIELDSGCQVGSCGTCRLPLERGSVVSVGTARDAVTAEGCLVCVSVPRGDVTLGA